MSFQIIEHPGSVIGAYTHDGPVEGLQEAWPKTMEILGKAGLFKPGRRPITAIDNAPASGQPHENSVFDLGIEIDDETTLPAEFTKQEIPAGEYVLYTHVGWYDGLGEAWHKVMSEAEAATGRKLSGGRCFEVYVDDPTETPKEKLRTAIYLPVF